MFCYRRFGHNEGDDPTFTQPIMYAKIPRPAVDRANSYRSSLVEEGVVTRTRSMPTVIAEMRACTRRRSSTRRRRSSPDKADWLDGQWAALSLPEGRGTPRRDRHGRRQAQGTRQRRSATFRTEASTSTRRSSPLDRGAPQDGRTPAQSIDWAHGRSTGLCGSLSSRASRCACPARISARGTFSQRHSGTRRPDHRGAAASPLNNIGADAGGSSRSSTRRCPKRRVLGFEYGYSLSDPDALVLWEAQFGDFANGAQVVSSTSSSRPASANGCACAASIMPPAAWL